MSKIKVGIIGCGGISHAHIPLLAKRSDDVELAAFADIREDAARAAAEGRDGAVYTTDYREILDRVDAVVVCVPTYVHADIVVDLLRKGKHVFCEKPMARTMEQANAILRASQDTGLPVQVGFVRRFDDEWLAFRKTIQDGRIGRPVIWHDVASGAGPAPIWFAQDELGGGPFLDGCIHNIDFALHTFGPAEWAFTHGRTMKSENTAIDTGTATIRFRSGDELMLTWSWGLPQGCSGARVFEFLGPEGTITWPRPAPEGEKHFVVDRGGDKVAEPYPDHALGQGYDRQIEEFVQVARGKKAPSAGITEGIESLRLCLAVLESARTCKVVQV